MYFDLFSKLFTVNCLLLFVICSCLLLSPFSFSLLFFVNYPSKEEILFNIKLTDLEFSVHHCHGPSAWASPLQGGNTCNNQILAPNLGPVASGHDHSVISIAISCCEPPVVSLPTSNTISWHRLATQWPTCKVVQKTISFAEKRWVNIPQFSKWLTTWHVTVYACCHHKLCASLQLCVSGESALPSYHQGTSWSMARWSIVFPGGMTAVDQLPTGEERKTTHPGKDCMLRQRGSFRHHLRCHADLWCELCSQGEQKWNHFWSARGTWHFKCQGHEL